MANPPRPLSMIVVQKKLLMILLENYLSARILDLIMLNVELVHL
jgi:hypothetical protein